MASSVLVNTHTSIVWLFIYRLPHYTLEIQGLFPEIGSDQDEEGSGPITEWCSLTVYNAPCATDIGMVANPY